MVRNDTAIYFKRAINQFFGKYLVKNLTISEIDDNSIMQVLQVIKEIEEPDAKFDNIFSDPDLLVFGTNEVLEEFKSGQLREIYVSDKFTSVDFTGTKTKINIVRSSKFSSMFGDMVGIRFLKSFE